jgi:hypothetical protein
VHISFDLDDTLICGASVPAEPPVSCWHRWRYPERLRRGTRSLMTTLLRRRCKIWIYTSSCRSPRYLKSWFARLGIPLEGIVNQIRHEGTVGLRGPSKYPPAFGIDLHVDDSPGVAMEGADHRFAVLVVAPEDPDWVERVLCEVDARIRSNDQWSAGQLASTRSFDPKKIFRAWSAPASLSEYRIPSYVVGYAKTDTD